MPPVSIHMEVTSNLPLVRIQVNGSPPAWFVVDTGAEVSVVDSEWADSLGLKLGEDVEASTTGGAIDAAFVTGVVLTFDGAEPGGAELRDVKLLALPLAGLEAALGRPLGGILGSDLFGRFVIEFDYTERALRLHEADAYRYDGDGEVIPVLIEDDTPFVTTTLEGPGGRRIAAKLLVDTGASGALTLNTPFVERHRLLESSGRVIPLTGAGLLAGSARRYAGRTAALYLGSARIPNVLTILAQDEEGDLADSTYAGLIGGELLRRFVLVVDYPHQRIVLLPSAEAARPTEFDASGLSLGAFGPGFRSIRVRLVLPGSPAEEAGVEPGDVLLTFDGRGAEEYGLDELRQVLRHPGDRHMLTLRRGEDTIAAEITTRPLI